MNAQRINFNLMDPHPDIKGGLFGGMDLADIDGDGDLDLYISGREDGWVSQDHSTFYLNDGSGNFTEMMDDGLPDLQSSNSVFGDIDGDGDEDLLVNGDIGPTGFTGLFLNDGNGNFTASTTSTFAQIVDGDIELIDLDADDDLDIFLTGKTVPDEDLIRIIYVNDGQGFFTALSETGLDNSHIDQAEFGDVDGDGDLDLLGLGSDDNDNTVFSWYLNDGSNGYTQMDTGLDHVSGGDFAIGDLDEDEDLDLLISGSEDGISEPDVYLYLNDGNGNFSRMNTGNTFKKVDLGKNDFLDFDGDGDLDICMTGSGAGGGTNIHTTIYENFGNNTFVQADSLIGSYVSRTTFGDINGDNLMDFILSGTTVGTPTFKTWVYLNNTSIISHLSSIKGEDLKVFPNPSNGRINFKVEQEDNFKVEIFNLLGKLIYSTQVRSGSDATLHLDLPSGAYILIAQGEKLAYQSKLSIIR